MNSREKSPGCFAIAVKLMVITGQSLAGLFGGGEATLPKELKKSNTAAEKDESSIAALCQKITKK